MMLYRALLFVSSESDQSSPRLLLEGYGDDETAARANLHKAFAGFAKRCEFPEDMTAAMDAELDGRCLVSTVEPGAYAMFSEVKDN